VKCGRIGESVFVLKPEFEAVQEWADSLGLPAQESSEDCRGGGLVKLLGQDNLR